MNRTTAWLLIVTPGLPFFLVALAAAVGWLPDPLLYLHADVVLAATAFGVLFSGHAALLVWRGGTARRRTRREVAAARIAAAQERSHFLQRLDHELENPISAALGQLTILTGTPLTPPQQRHLAELAAQLKRVGNLTGDLRRVADLRPRPLDRRPVDLEEVAHEALEIIQDEGAAQSFLAGGGRLSCERETPWKLPLVSGDHELLLLALTNLLQNACKFTAPQGQVKVQLGQEGHGVTVKIIDTGGGIPEKDLAQVGQELYRGGNVDGVPGRGLGLALARAIIERHGGVLDVQSAVGTGTLVTVRLPTEGREKQVNQGTRG